MTPELLVRLFIEYALLIAGIVWLLTWKRSAERPFRWAIVGFGLAYGVTLALGYWYDLRYLVTNALMPNEVIATGTGFVGMLFGWAFGARKRILAAMTLLLPVLLIGWYLIMAASWTESSRKQHESEKRNRLTEHSQEP